ncbi:PQQ-dependent sugar dehydrogenase [Urbifossiella limnaea]|uniref:Soluble aldose sugar dehydrogenase YliI n=1 Tax=Urbifossiella limnaea TaxID=2528023 RepID=A0A517XSN7_9BACT|nr:PQQ-dependent sugar dehydrogenase [Urbifossiella limnaea]QDU20525.1 Soluble aldose sugar dehydrogenase YliI precursor [Urbifossiella limnaea]
MRAVVLFALSAATVASWSAAQPDPSKSVPPPRQPWTTSKVTGSPEPPPPFKVARAFPNVTFKQPLLIARAPGTDRLFVGEQDGVIYSIPNRPDAQRELFFDLRKDLKTLAKNAGAKEIESVYGLVFHPKFEQNRQCFVCYTMKPKDKSPYLEDGTRVSRFTVPKADPPRIDPASEEIVLTFLGGGHNGGDLHFGPDGMLYISTGDASPPNPPDRLSTGQDCSDLLGSVLRIDIDKNDAGKNYAVPKDNPFVGLPNVRPEIWAFGFRNPWRMSFDRQTGALWIGDVGWEQWEMVHRIEKGGNYGWSITEARTPIKPAQPIGPAPIRPPAIELPHTIACSVTGGYVYRGKKFPELVGKYVFGDWETRRMWAAQFDGERLTAMPEVVKPSIRVVAFGEDNAGELYFADHDSGNLYTLERNAAAGANAAFPKTLSETGLFGDRVRPRFGMDKGPQVEKWAPLPGVVKYEPVLPQWQDGAEAEWYIAVPGEGKVALFDEPRPLPGQVNWHNFGMRFPAGTVLAKTISLKQRLQDRKGVRVETQLLHFDGEDWRGYTYAWRPDGSDADLVPADGAERTYTVFDPLMPDSRREHVHTFFSRTQCLSCHNSWSGYALSFVPKQLNGSDEKNPWSKVGNQLRNLSVAGYFERLGPKDEQRPIDADYLKGIGRFSRSPGSVVADQPALEAFARSYLHVNCAHCHRFGGGGGQVVLELDQDKSLKDTGILDVRPKQGDFGIPDARLVAPGDPFRSVLLYRMARFGAGRMPHVGSERPDPRALNNLMRWIRGLHPAAQPEDPANPDANLNDPRVALRRVPGLSGPLNNGINPPRPELLAAAAKLPPGPARDLFEGYFPVEPGARKLGPTPRPTTILALTGDATRGEALFFAEQSQCAKCHKVGERGTAVGPDLTAVAKTRSRAELLDSLLNPSARVEPQFAAYLVRTTDGRQATGLLVRRDGEQVVVRDAQNELKTFAAGDVEAVQPSRLSLMPEALLAGLTPQQAADLLTYLEARK